MWQTASGKAPRHQLLARITAVLGLALVSNIVLQAQQCEETAQSQIRDALDKTTNRVLLREVIDDYGEEAKQILVQIAGDGNQTPRRRGQAIQLLGEHRSEAGEKLLLAMLDDPETVCSALNPLQEYRDPELIPRLIAMLDDHRSCGEVVRFSIGSSEKQQKTGFDLPDEAVGALEHLTGKRFERERDLFIIGHRSIQPWKDWWRDNREAFQAAPASFVAPDSPAKEDKYPCSVQKIAVSPDGTRAFSAGKSYDPWVRAWDIETGRQIWTAPNVRDEDAQAVAVSPDGRMVALGTSNGALKIFDAATGARLHFIVVGSGVDDVAFSPDGLILASASDDGKIRLFDPKTWCETKRLDNSGMTVSIAFSPDNRLLAAATFERVRLWDLAAGNELRSFHVRPGTMPKMFADAAERDAQLWKMAWQVAFSPDGKFLATGSSDAVQIWSPSTGQELCSTSSDGQVASLHYSPDGQWVVWGNDHDQLIKWNPTAKKRSRIKNEPSLGDTAITPNGKLILSPGAGTEIAVFDLETRRKVGILSCSKPK